MHAFAYLISPGTSGQRSFHYPNIKKRISFLVQAAKTMSIEVEPNFDSLFSPETEPENQTEKLLVATADLATEALLDNLINLANEHVKSKGIPQRNVDNVTAICKDFEKIVPITAQYALSDILNAGWRCSLDPQFWQNAPQISDKSRVLGDLVLKSFEIMEVYKRLEAGHDPNSCTNSK